MRLTSIRPLLSVLPLLPVPPLCLLLLLPVSACGGIAHGQPDGAVPDAGSPDDGSIADADATPATACVRTHRTSSISSSPAGFTSDATHLYWFDDSAGPGVVYVTDKCADGPVTQLAQLPRPIARIVQDGDSLYAATYNNDPQALDGAVVAIAKSDGRLTQLAAAPSGAFGLAVGGGWVVWTERTTGRVARVHEDGSGSETLPLSVTKPMQVAILADGTVCALGAALSCLLPTSQVLSTTIAGRDPTLFSTDGRALYVGARDPAGNGSIDRVTTGATLAVSTLLDDPDDAGLLSMSGLVALARGVYVAFGTGTLRWIPGDGSPFQEKVIASTLPPFVFYADDDGVYWDALSGLEMAPPLE